MAEINQVVVIGNGDLARILIKYMKRDGYNILGIMIEKEFIRDKFIDDYPVLSFEDLSIYEKDKVGFIVAIAHLKMNKVREEIMKRLIEEGYRLNNYVSPNSIVFDAEISGVNNIIMDGAIIEPQCKIGSGNIFWPQTCISHDTIIRDFCTFTSGVKIGGNSFIDSRCFFGLNSSVNEKVIVSKGTLLGANTNLRFNTMENDVIVSPKSVKLDYKSNHFFNN